MVIGFITEVTLKATWWVLYQTYSGLHYLYYGHVPTPEEKMLSQLTNIEDANKQLHDKIKHLEELVSLRESKLIHEKTPVSVPMRLRPRSHSNSV